MHDQQIEELIAENLELKAKNVQNEQDLRVFRGVSKLMITAMQDSNDPLMPLVSLIAVQTLLKDLSHAEG
jgi:hypothetical protein